MKRLLAFLFALILLVSCIGCAKEAPVVVENVDDDDEESMSVEDWFDAVSASIGSIPDAARLTGEEICRALTGDNRYLLMQASTQAPYLWDLREQTKIDIYPADGETETILLTDSLRMITSLPGHSLGDVSDPDEAIAYVLQYSSFIPLIPNSDLGGHYLPVIGAGQIFVLDASTGALYGSTQGEIRGVCKDTMLIRPDSSSEEYSSTEVLLRNIGSEATLTLDLAEGFESSDPYLAGASFLPDGSVCGLLCTDVETELKAVTNSDGEEIEAEVITGEEYTLVVRNPKTKDAQNYPLGVFPFGNSPYHIIGIGDQWIAAFSYAISRCPVILIDRETNELHIVSSTDNGLTVSEWVDHIPESNEAAPMLYSAIGDSCLLLYNRAAAEYILYLPETRQFRPLFEEKRDDITYPVYLSGNGESRFYVQQAAPRESPDQGPMEILIKLDPEPPEES